MGSNTVPEMENVKSSPWLYMTFNADPAIILEGGTSQLTADFNNEYDNGTGTVTPFDPAMGHLPDGCMVTFTTTLGSVGSDTVDVGTVNGLASATLTADEGTGPATVTAQLNQELLESSVIICPNPLYVNTDTGNDAWSGTSPVFVSGDIGPLKTVQVAIIMLELLK